MAILVASAPLPAAPYVDALRRAAPGVPVWTEADAPPPDAVEALLAWRLRPGQVAQYPALRVVCSVAAGTDKLLAVPDLPPALPVTRVVDPAQALQMAQFALACALAHTRELERYAAQLGAVGQAMAQAFLAVGYPVAGWSRRPRPTCWSARCR
ncbi:hypothetical protein ABXN37_04990 [Piscinibacter sakaiensis]|uniref:hypothetical protein n=1 Tax=Piscinibacter sakaiensis TaxID=1547922 RepID=UPI00372CA2A0